MLGRIGIARRSAYRFYHSIDHTVSRKPSIDHVILDKALTYIPRFGFHEQCITQAIRDMSYPDSLSGVFSSGNNKDFEVVLHWLKFNRNKLHGDILDPTDQFHAIKNEYDRVTYLINKRLESNIAIKPYLHQALAQLVVPYNIPSSLEELHQLSDDIAFYAGDNSNDFAWYLKRMGLSTVYVSSELYMLQDTSENFRDTKEFVKEKVDSLRSLGTGYTNIEQWAAFNGISLINLIKSQLLRG